MAKYKTNNASALEHLGDIPDIPDTLGGFLKGTMVEEKGAESSHTITNETTGKVKELPSKSNKNETALPAPSKKAKTSKSTEKGKALNEEPNQQEESTEPVKLEGKDLWEQFVNMCESDKGLRKDLGRNGTAKLMRIENDIVDTFSMCRVNDNTITTMVNAILRSFVLHYKKNFLQYKKEKHTTII